MIQFHGVLRTLHSRPSHFSASLWPWPKIQTSRLLTTRRSPTKTLLHDWRGLRLSRPASAAFCSRSISPGWPLHYRTSSAASESPHGTKPGSSTSTALLSYLRFRLPVLLQTDTADDACSLAAASCSAWPRHSVRRRPRSRACSFGASCKASREPPSRRRRRRCSRPLIQASDALGLSASGHCHWGLDGHRTAARCAHRRLCGLAVDLLDQSSALHGARSLGLVIGGIGACRLSTVNGLARTGPAGACRRFVGLRAPLIGRIARGCVSNRCRRLFCVLGRGAQAPEPGL